MAWLEMGGVYAVPGIRGGGEYGDAWHPAGTGENRPVVFRVLIAAAECLIDEGYTSTEKLAISGGSNGGTLSAAVLMSITPGAGHGGAVGLSESLDRIADEYAFFWKVPGM